ncbi:MAG: hypothetical protein ACJASL_004511 [Paraglaciecola sp.]|jgi:hypothetical protein
MKLKVYLSGEIHSNWRLTIAEGIKAAALDIELSGPNTNHAASDDCGERIPLCVRIVDEVIKIAQERIAVKNEK